jgi:hypothetical protein
VRFREEDLAALAAAEEIEIETRAAAGAVHRTVVWPLVKDDVVYLRSYRGENGRWYREAMADPVVALHLGGRRVAARVEPATDADSVRACSEALEVKYRDSYSLAAMLAPSVLPTTIRLVPA